MRRAFDLVAPNVPAFGRLTGKKLYAGKVSHEPNNALPRLIRLFGMLFDVAENDLTHTGVNTLRVSLRSKDADFGIRPCPVAHAGKEIVVPSVLLHPYKSHGLIRKAPCRQHFECFTEARERDPEKQSAVLSGKLTDRKCLDVFNSQEKCFIRQMGGAGVISNPQCWNICKVGAITALKTYMMKKSGQEFVA